MKKIIFALLLISVITQAQNDLPLKCSRYSNYLYFLPPNNDLILSSWAEYGRSSKDSNTVFEEYVTIFSNKDGSVLKEINVSEKDKIVLSFITSHDGLSFVIVYASKNYFRNYKGPFEIKKYLINEDRWVWEQRWESETAGLNLAYSEHDDQIIIITSSRTYIFNSETGILLKSSDAISNIGIDENYSKTSISKNGRYFAYWEIRYLTFSDRDESGLILLLDFMWYGTKWLLCFGKIPQYVYVWDIFEDKLACKFPIPFEALKGAPAFTDDEKDLLVGPFKGKCYLYSIEENKLKREFMQNESVNEQYYSPDYRIISADQKFFASTFHSDKVFLVDFENGCLLGTFTQGGLSFPQHLAAISFSSDSKYFAIINDKHHLCLYDTKTWKKLWETILRFKY